LGRNQIQDKIHLETEAVLTILSKIFNGEWSLVSSEVVEIEISKTPDSYRREKVFYFVKLADEKIIINDWIINRAKKIQEYGINSFDALHLACAEFKEVDVFLTTDAELIRKVEANLPDYKTKVNNPIKWLMEVL